MPSFQDTAPGAKSSKFTGLGPSLNPFTPFLAQPGDIDDPQDEVQPTMAEDIDQRLRLYNHREEASQPMMQQQEEATNQPEAQSSVETNNQNPVQYTLKNEIKKEEIDDNSDDDSDFDDDDDPALEAFRQRRLAQMKQTQTKEAENKAKGHGDYRTISQDEFLPECTGSEYVAVHFFHRDFERCKIMDHHLKTIAQMHLSCKFVRIDAEKSPFFIAKLNVKTLPTLILFKDGKFIDCLTGFEGLTSDTKNPDEFKTSQLGYWLENLGAIEYEGPESDEEERTSDGRSRLGMLQSRFHAYDEDT